MRKSPYSDADREYAYSLYAQGLPTRQALTAMRDRCGQFGEKTWNSWRLKYSWAKRRAAADAIKAQYREFLDKPLERLLFDLEQVRQSLVAKFDSVESVHSQDAYALARISKQIADLTQQIEARDKRVGMEVLNRAFGELLEELTALPDVAKVLAKHKRKVAGAVERAASAHGRES